MAAQAMRQTFDKHRSFSCTRDLDRFARGQAHGEKIVAVYRAAGDFISLCMLRQPLHSGMRRERCEFRIAVVLTDENDRQLPQARDVQRFMKWTRLTGTIAKKNHRYLASFFFFSGKRRSKGQRYRPADHSRSRDKPRV